MTLTIVSGAAFLIAAQTNPPSSLTNSAPVSLGALAGVAPDASKTNAASDEWLDMHVQSDHLNGTLEDHVYQFIFAGNVRVTDPQVKMTCELLTVRMPEDGGKVNSIIAETNVVIDATDNDGKPVHATGQKAVYSYKIEQGVTNELVTLTGDASVRSEKVSGTGEAIIWHRAVNRFEVVTPHLVLPQVTKSLGTNARPPTVTSPKKTP
jgi:lipopolysaccharide transport protein LptA